MLQLIDHIYHNINVYNSIVVFPDRHDHVIYEYNIQLRNKDYPSVVVENPATYTFSAHHRMFLIRNIHFLDYLTNPNCNLKQINLILTFDKESFQHVCSCLETILPETHEKIYIFNSSDII